MKFTADQHWGHNNIILYEARPPWTFEHMVYLWNKTVAPEETVWVVGDFVWRNFDYWIPRLNGNIHVVRGNHNHFSKYRRNGVTCHKGPIYLELPLLGTVKLTHHPDHLSPIINLCGHVHGWWEQLGNCINVGVDVWKYKPVSEQDIAKRWKNGTSSVLQAMQVL